MRWSPENVWDNSCPPAVEPRPRDVRVELAGRVLAECDRALRVLEFKGAARYLDALIGDRRY
jgi:uncharacterized protein (DUF427 family)